MRSKATKSKVKFCTECGEELNEFWADPRADDYKGLLKHRVECLQKGRPAHRMCSKLFIADSRDPLPSTTTPKGAPRKKLTELKSKVMEKIELEEAKAKKKPSKA